MPNWELFLALQNTSSMASKKSLKTIGFKVSNNQDVSQRLGFTCCSAINPLCHLSSLAFLDLSYLTTEARRVIFLSLNIWIISESFSVSRNLSY